jgi:hypothetical protein
MFLRERFSTTRLWRGDFQDSGFGVVGRNEILTLMQLEVAAAVSILTAAAALSTKALV